MAAAPTFQIEPCGELRGRVNCGSHPRPIRRSCVDTDALAHAVRADAGDEASARSRAPGSWWRP